MNCERSHSRKEMGLDEDWASLASVHAEGRAAARLEGEGLGVHFKGGNSKRQWFLKQKTHVRLTHIQL